MQLRDPQHLRERMSLMLEGIRKLFSCRSEKKKEEKPKDEDGTNPSEKDIPSPLQLNILIALAPLGTTPMVQVFYMVSFLWLMFYLGIMIEKQNFEPFVFSDSSVLICGLSAFLIILFCTCHALYTYTMEAYATYEEELWRVFIENYRMRRSPPKNKNKISNSSANTDNSVKFSQQAATVEASKQSVEEPKKEEAQPSASETPASSNRSDVIISVSGSDKEPKYISNREYIMGYFVPTTSQLYRQLKKRYKLDDL